jgi:hypothetical protein
MKHDIDTKLYIQAWNWIALGLNGFVATVLLTSAGFRSVDAGVFFLIVSVWRGIEYPALNRMRKDYAVWGRTAGIYFVFLVMAVAVLYISTSLVSFFIMIGLIIIDVIGIVCVCKRYQLLRLFKKTFIK